MTCMRARMSSILGPIGLPTVELAALERLKNSPYTYIGKKNWCCSFFSATLNQILFILAGKDDTYKSLYISFKFGQIRSWTTELAALEHLKSMLPLFSFHSCGYYWKKVR